MAPEKLGKRALLAACIADVLAATTPDEVEEKFQKGLERLEGAYGCFFSSGYIRASEKLRWEGANVRGLQLADTMAVGRLVPRFGPRRRLTIDGRTYRVGYGGNSTGERYAWCAAEERARALLAAVLPKATVNVVLAFWRWPHRVLRILSKAADPVAEGE